MITQKDIENLTKEQALQLHKEMWLAMAECKDINTEGIDVESYREANSRMNFKYNYLDARELKVKNGCFLCEYAVQQYKKNLKDNDNKYCKYCPANWCGTEQLCLIPEFMCECGKCNGLNWKTSNVLKIANIQPREEIKNVK